MHLCSLVEWLLLRRATFSSQTLSTHFREFLHWLYLDPSVDSWQRWHDSYMATLRSFSLKDRLNVYITRVAAVRVVFILVSMAALEASDAPPTTLSIQRDLLSISMGLGAITIAFVLFVVADSGSTRRLFKVGSTPCETDFPCCPPAVHAPVRPLSSGRCHSLLRPLCTAHRCAVALNSPASLRGRAECLPLHTKQPSLPSRPILAVLVLHLRLLLCYNIPSSLQPPTCLWLQE